MTLKFNKIPWKRGPWAWRLPRPHSGSLYGQNYSYNNTKMLLGFFTVAFAVLAKTQRWVTSRSPLPVWINAMTPNSRARHRALHHQALAVKKDSFTMSLTKQHGLIWLSFNHWIGNLWIFCARKREGHIQFSSADPSPVAAWRKRPGTTELTSVLFFTEHLFYQKERGTNFGVLGRCFLKNESSEFVTSKKPMDSYLLSVIKFELSSEN